MTYINNMLNLMDLRDFNITSKTGLNKQKKNKKLCNIHGVLCHHSINITSLMNNNTVNKILKSENLKNLSIRNNRMSHRQYMVYDYRY